MLYVHINIFKQIDVIRLTIKESICPQIRDRKESTARSEQEQIVNIKKCLCRARYGG